MKFTTLAMLATLAACDPEQDRAKWDFSVPFNPQIETGLPIDTAQAVRSALTQLGGTINPIAGAQMFYVRPTDTCPCKWDKLVCSDEWLTMWVCTTEFGTNTTAYTMAHGLAHLLGAVGHSTKPNDIMLPENPFNPTLYTKEDIALICAGSSVKNMPGCKTGLPFPSIGGT